MTAKRRLYGGITLAVIGSSLVVFLHVESVYPLPDSPYKWFVAFAYLILAVLAGMALNALPFLDIKNIEQARREAEDLYDTINHRVTPLLWNGIEDVLRRKVPAYLDSLDANERCLQFYVLAEINALLRIVGSTVDAYQPVRKIALTHHEGVVGFAIDRGAIVVAERLPAGKIWNVAGKEIGVQRPLEAHNLEKCDPAVKWIYAMPIFERSITSDTIVGVFTVDSTAEVGKELFMKQSFQSQVSAFASDVAPYLEAYKSISIEPPEVTERAGEAASASVGK